RRRAGLRQGAGEAKAGGLRDDHPWSHLYIPLGRCGDRGPRGSRPAQDPARVLGRPGGGHSVAAPVRGAGAAQPAGCERPRSLPGLDHRRNSRAEERGSPVTYFGRRRRTARRRLGMELSTRYAELPPAVSPLVSLPAPAPSPVERKVLPFELSTEVLAEAVATAAPVVVPEAPPEPASSPAESSSAPAPAEPSAEEVLHRAARE